MKLTFLLFVFSLCVMVCWARFSNTYHRYSKYGGKDGYNRWRSSSEEDDSDDEDDKNRSYKLSDYLKNKYNSVKNSHYSNKYTYNKYGYNKYGNYHSNRYGYKGYGYRYKSIIDTVYDKHKDYWANKYRENNYKNPWNWGWNDKKNDLYAWNQQWQKLIVWRQEQLKKRYESPSAGCSGGKVLYCWKCDDASSASDCKSKGHWEGCDEGESCFYDQSMKAVYSRYSYKTQWITKISRGCMKESTCKSGKSLCKGYGDKNCRECGLGCWYKCEHPPCPRRVQCRKCDGTSTEAACVDKDEYETCPGYIKDPVCEERWECTYKAGSRFSSRCVERVSCLSNQKGYNLDYNSGYRNVECKPAYCPEPEPETTTTPKPTTTTPKPTTTTPKPTTTTPKPTTTTPKPTTTTPKPTTTTLPCPGPGEEILDYKDRKKMTITLVNPNKDSDDPKNFLQGFPRDENGIPEPLFFTKTDEKETYVKIKFKNGKSYDIKKVYFETKKCNWVRVKLFKGNKLQINEQIPPEIVTGSKWSAHEMEVDGEGITRMEITFGYQTGELRAKGAFFTFCP